MKTAYIVASYDEKDKLRGYYCRIGDERLTLAKDCAIFYTKIEECPFKNGQVWSLIRKDGSVVNGYWKIEAVNISDDPDYHSSLLKFDN